MIHSPNYLSIRVLLILLCWVFIFSACKNKKEAIHDSIPADKIAVIYPDYSGTVIPPNIAPLNFEIEEKGKDYFIKIHSKKGRPIEIYSRNPEIIIPEAEWRSLLSVNQGNQLYFDVSVKTEADQWMRYSAIANTIAHEPIDGYLVYRKIHPSQNTWREMGLYQRNLQNYDETRILENKYFKNGCCHCHAFCNNRTEKMTIDIRSKDYENSLLLVEGDNVNKVGLTFGFTSWHPSGRILACSFNKPKLLIHASRNEIRDIVDLDSWIGYYVIDSKQVKTTPQISRKDYLENYPTWSPNGKYLYFCSAPILWDDRNKIPVESYDRVKYDLYRIGYDIENDQWSDLEPLILSDETGLSINQPRISPDGRWLSFSMCKYSCWPNYHPNSDLYIVDLNTAQTTGKFHYRKMEISTDQCESWHTWSSNSRWIVFSSKKENPLFSRTYMAYVDTTGGIHKSLLVPQKDPTFYQSYLKTYTIPELVVEPVSVKREKLASVLRSSRKSKPDLPITMATPKAGTVIPQQERE